MTTPEGKVKAWARNQYDKYFPGHYRISPKGGAYGNTGTSDTIMCWHGVFIAIEVKEDDREPTALQYQRLKLVAEAGGVAAVLRGKDHAKLALIRDTVLTKVKEWQKGSV